MSEGTSLARREAAPMAPAPVMTDDEINRTYRLAQMFAASSLFKDVKQAEQAFAKLAVGRELGLNSIQSLQLYAMEGKIECPYPLLGARIRERPGYDYRVLWRVEGEDGWVADEDGRPVTGCKVIGTVEGEEPRSVTWTQEDSDLAELDRPTRGGAKSNHIKYPRSMYLARALGLLVRLHMPEVVNGLQVYAEGELGRDERERLGGHDGAAEGPGWGTTPIPWVAAAKALMRRAERLERADIADEGLWQMKLVGQSPETMQRELDDAKAELDAAAVLRRGSVDATAEEEPSLAPTVEGVLERAATLGHQGIDRTTATAATAGQADEVVEGWVRESHAILDALEARGPANPEVETGEGVKRPAEDAAVTDDAPGLTPEEEAELARLRDRLVVALASPDAVDGADEIQGQIDALESRRQPGLF